MQEKQKIQNRCALFMWVFAGITRNEPDTWGKY